MKKFQLVTLLLGIFHWYGLSASGVDSLLIIFEQNKSSDKEELLLNCEQYLQQLTDREKFTEVIIQSEKAISTAKKYGDLNYLAKFIFLKGFANERMSKYTEALTNFDQVLNLAKNGKEQLIIMKTFSKISSIHQQMGDYQKAYDYQMKALRGFEKLNDLAGICESNYLIGTIFYYQKRYEQAREQYLTSLELAKCANHPRMIYSALGALGATYEELDNLEASLDYNRKALQLAKSIKYDSGIAYTLNNLGICYLQTGNCKEAENAILESMRIKEKMIDSWGVLSSKFALVKLYKKCNINNKTLPSLLAALEMSKKLGSKSRELQGYELLIDFYNKKNPLIAYEYAKKFIALKDTVLTEKTLDKMGQSHQRYELEKKEHEILMLKAENKFLNVNRENQRLYRLLFMVSIFLLLITVFWFFSRIKMHRRINEMLASKNDLLNLKNEEIRIKNKQLEHSNEDLAQFAHVASHDLKEPLRMIHSYTTLLERRYHDQLDDSGKEFMHFIVDAVDRMKILLDDLLNYSRSGRQEMADTLVSVAEVMMVVEMNLQKQIEEQCGNLIVKNENLPSIMAHQSQLVQLMQNLVSNGLKFCDHKDPVVIVDCEKKNNQFVFSVKDNGIGISKNNQEKVFEMFRRLHTREEYVGTGIGLATCKKVVANMGGDIWVASEEGQGSTFYFAVPCPIQKTVVS